jgi:hypothetical protein
MCITYPPESASASNPRSKSFQVPGKVDILLIEALINITLFFIIRNWHEVADWLSKHLGDATNKAGHGSMLNLVGIGRHGEDGRRFNLDTAKDRVRVARD